MAAETIGLLHGGYLYMPQFLVDYDKSYESIGKLRALNVDRLCTSHCGILEQPDETVWQRFEDGLVKTREVITEILQKYASEEERMDAMREVFWKPELKMKTARTQEAFDMNAQAMLKTIERVVSEEK
jgi:hypothetical protein